MKKALTLYELNGLVREVLEADLPDAYWVQAELSEVREVHGHCYMELVQKDPDSNTPIARASAKCWRTQWMLLRPAFERETGQVLHAGMQVLLQVHARFHENYGFSWIVDDIDPTYTLGDMARKRLEILRRLKEEGVLDLQKDLSLSLFAQRIAVISSAGAAGYGDFCSQLEHNEYGFRFTVELFSATMQGEEVEKSIIAALNAINARLEEFDAVVIIRGGGAVSDLSGFDTLALAENAANFPLPVITGIGHERDESVLDRVAYTRVKTPTAAAAFLIDHLLTTFNRILDAQERAATCVQRRLQTEKLRLHRVADKVPALFSVVRTRQEGRLEELRLRLLASARRKTTDGLYRLKGYSERIPDWVCGRINTERHCLDLLSGRALALDPQRLLKRGFSVTLFNGKSVRDASALKKGDQVETRFWKGTAKSRVE